MSRFLPLHVVVLLASLAAVALLAVTQRPGTPAISQHGAKPAPNKSLSVSTLEEESPIRIGYYSRIPRGSGAVDRPHPPRKSLSGIAKGRSCPQSTRCRFFPLGLGDNYSLASSMTAVVLPWTALQPESPLVSSATGGLDPTRVPLGNDTLRVLYWREIKFGGFVPSKMQRQFDILMGFHLNANLRNPDFVLRPHDVASWIKGKAGFNGSLGFPTIPFSQRTGLMLFASSRECTHSRSQRPQIVENLRALLPGLITHGKCFDRKFFSLLKSDRDRQEGLARSIQGFKFFLAIENTIAESYVTEKLWLGVRGGSVPVYLGAPDIGSTIPPLSFGPGGEALPWFVNVHDFEDLAALAAHIRELGANETAYGRYHEWRHYFDEATTPLNDLKRSGGGGEGQELAAVQAFMQRRGEDSLKPDRRLSVCKLCEPSFLRTAARKGFEPRERPWQGDRIKEHFKLQTKKRKKKKRKKKPNL